MEQDSMEQDSIEQKRKFFFPDAKSSWEWTRMRSKYHFNNRIEDAIGDYYFPLGRFEGDWSTELNDQLVKQQRVITWATRAHGSYYNVLEGSTVTSPMLPQEEYDLESAGYTKDLALTGVVEKPDMPEIFIKMHDFFALEDSWTRLHIQRPGQMFNLHIDKLYDRTPDIDRVTRIVVFLSDWEPGHFYTYGTLNLTHWRAGDVHTFNWRDVPHATANASRTPRAILIMTGLSTEKTREIIQKGSAESVYRL